MVDDPEGGTFKGRHGVVKDPSDFGTCSLKNAESREHWRGWSNEERKELPGN